MAFLNEREAIWAYMKRQTPGGQRKRLIMIFILLIFLKLHEEHVCSTLQMYAIDLYRIPHSDRTRGEHG